MVSKLQVAHTHKLATESQSAVIGVAPGGPVVVLPDMDARLRQVEQSVGLLLADTPLTADVQRAHSCTQVSLNLLPSCPSFCWSSQQPCIDGVVKQTQMQWPLCMAWQHPSRCCYGSALQGCKQEIYFVVQVCEARILTMNTCQSESYNSASSSPCSSSSASSLAEIGKLTNAVRPNNH